VVYTLSFEAIKAVKKGLKEARYSRLSTFPRFFTITSKWRILYFNQPFFTE
jgi:hypothetical protein